MSAVPVNRKAGYNGSVTYITITVDNMTDHSIRNPDAFRRYYGPWALIGGASDGTGEQFALQLAEAGLNCVLVARRETVLNALARRLESDYQVQTRVIVQDLSEPGAGEALCRGVDDLDIGLYVANTGGGSGGIPFEQRSLEDWRGLININIHTPMEVCHGLIGPMLERGRGGFLLMGSGTGLGGLALASVYSACKGFSLNLAESLWADYHSRGIDVINVAAPAMDTPNLRRVAGDRIEQGLIPDVFDPAEIVRKALESLPEGPCVLFPAGPEKENWQQLQAARTARAAASARHVAAIFGDKSRQ